MTEAVLRAPRVDGPRRRSRRLAEETRLQDRGGVARPVRGVAEVEESPPPDPPSPPLDPSSSLPLHRSPVV